MRYGKDMDCSTGMRCGKDKDFSKGMRCGKDMDCSTGEMWEGYGLQHRRDVGRIRIAAQE